MYQYATTVEVPEAALDPIARITLQRFNEAVRWQSVEHIGNKSLHSTMQDCYDQINGITSCEDQEIINALGVDMYVNLTTSKTGVVQAFLNEILLQSGTMPWIISPTPIPTLSRAGRDKAIALVRERLFTPGYSAPVMDTVSEVKTLVLAEERDIALQASKNMERLMSDQCVEGGWNLAMKDMIQYFASYPFAVMHGPVPVREPRLSWAGNTLRTKYETFYRFNAVSPWDFWYSPDSPDTQKGSGVFIRQRWTRNQLLQAAKLPSYFKENIHEVFEEVTKNTEYTLGWFSQNPDKTGYTLANWSNCTATIDILLHYGYFSGEELAKYGVFGLEAREFYNASVTIVGRKTVQVVLLSNPTASIRPVYTASFYNQPDKIPGYSIPQKIRGIERAYMATLRYLMVNAHNSSGPITEADYTRIARHMSDGDLGRILPNMIYPVDSELGNGGPAFRMTSIPSVLGGYVQILNYFKNLIDEITNIPAALHGTAVGSGANRTFRGMMQLQGNAVKAIQDAVGNLDEYMFGKIGQLLFNYNMLYEKDNSIKGDCKVYPQGVSGLLKREVDKQASYEVLQLVGAAGNQLSTSPRGADVAQWSMYNALSNAGVPSEVLGTIQEWRNTPAQQPSLAEGAPI